MVGGVEQRVTGLRREEAVTDSSVREASTAQLVGQLSDQVSRLAREEIKLAVAEVQAKGKKVGVGAGLFGGAGVLAWFGVMSLIAGLVLLLATVMAPWLAAFVVAVGVLLFGQRPVVGLAIAGVAGAVLLTTFLLHHRAPERVEPRLFEPLAACAVLLAAGWVAAIL